MRDCQTLSAGAPALVETRLGASATSPPYSPLSLGVGNWSCEVQELLMDGPHLLRTLPTLCIDRVVRELDVLSVHSLSLTDSWLKNVVLKLHYDRQRTVDSTADVSLEVVGCHSPRLVKRLIAAASEAILSSALHTPDPRFQFASVIPSPFSARDAASAVNCASLIRLLPPPPTPPLQLSADTLVVAAGSRGRGRGRGRRLPPPKLTPLQIAILTSSARVVEVLLDEPRGTQDALLAASNADGRMARLDLAVSRLPAAALGRYTEKRRRDGTSGVVACKEVTVRAVDDPAATASPVYACMVSTKECVNTAHALKMAVLVHDAHVCELLLQRTSWKAPWITIEALLDPMLFACGASCARLGADIESPLVDELEEEDTELVDSAHFGERGQDDVRCAISFCEFLDECRFARNSLRIARAFTERLRVGDQPTDRAVHHAADYGDSALCSELLEGADVSHSVVAERLRWRILFEEGVRLPQILAATSSRDGESARRAVWHPCCQSHSVDDGLATNMASKEIEGQDLARLKAYASLVIARREATIKMISNS